MLQKWIFLCVAFLGFSWNADYNKTQKRFSGVFDTSVNQWCV